MKLPKPEPSTECADDFPHDVEMDKLNDFLANGHTPFAYSVKPLVLHGREQPPDFSRTNPSVMPAPDGHGYLVAVRETTFQFCPGHQNFAHRSFESRILLGVSDTPEGPVEFCGLMTKHYKKRARYKGPEDPRFVLHTTAAGVQETYLMNVLDRALQLSRVEFVHTEGRCVARETSRVPLWLEGTPRKRRQKNWLFLPGRQSAEGMPLLVYRLNPLEVISVNVTTGIAHTVSREAAHNCVPDLRGSTNLLPHPTQPHTFFGIGHETVFHAVYYSRAITVEEYAPLRFRLTGISERFGIPKENNTQCMHRIHYPSSLVFLDAAKEDLVISMGYMDCTTHSVRVRFDDFMDSIKPIKCN